MEAIMLPDGWKKVALGSLGKCITGLTYSPKDITDISGLLVLRSSNVQNGRLAFEDNVFVSKEVPEEQLTKEGDILICVRNGSKNLIGKNCLITKEASGCAHGAFMTIFRSNNPEFIYQLLQSDRYYNQVRRNLGATINSINTSDLYEFTFPLPPLPEQRKIAAILRTWDEGIEKLEKIRLKKLFLWKAQRTNLLKRLGRTFGFSEIGSVTSAVVGGGTPSRSNEEYWDGTIPWVSVKDLIAPVLSDTQEHISEKALKESASNLIPAFTPIVATRMAVGRAAYFTVDVAINQDLKALIPKKEYSPRYLFHCLRALEGKLAALGTGSTVNGITLDILREQLVPKADKNTQSIFINIADQNENELNILHEQIVRIKSQKRGLMQKLLTGKWPVKI